MQARRGTGPRTTVKGDFWLGEGQARALRFVGTVWIATKEKAYEGLRDLSHLRVALLYRH